MLISPDGMLNLLPFATLVDERGRLLVENYSITYLSSGRDLLRLQVARESKSAPLIVANPDFGLAGETLAQPAAAPNAGTSPTGQAQPEFERISFRALAGTIGEALDLKKQMPQASLLIGKDATETALKQAPAPRLLHIATHGFFLQDGENPVENTRGLGFTNFSGPRSANWAAKKETGSLMKGYYQRLLKGAGRGEARRQVQLEMLKNPKQRHPHYWTSFIQAGEWANLDGKP